MMMTICDRCGKRIPDDFRCFKGRFENVPYYAIRPLLTMIDLCYECGTDLVKWVEVGVKEESK